MLKSVSQKLFYILLLKGFLFACVVLSGCENFLDGTDLRIKLDNQIAYTNASECKVVVSQDTTAGMFLSSGERTVKTGYDFDIQFNLNAEDYVLQKGKEFTAVSAYDEAVSRADCIEFTIDKKESNSAGGIYVVTARVIKPSNDILIKANAVKLPKIISFSPSHNSTGVEQDSTIKIIFSKAVQNSEYFKNFNNISIESGSLNLIDSSDCYFNEPFFNDDNTVLSIPTIKGKSILPEESGIELKDITVILDLSKLTDNDGFVFESSEPFTYRINKHKDNVPPVINEIHLYSTNDADDYFYRELTDKAFDNWTESDFYTNHISKVNILIKGRDNSGSIKGVYVKEVFERNEKNELINEVIKKDLYGEDCFSDESGNFTINFDYDFLSEYKGIILLEISLADNAGNESPASSYEVLLEKELVLSAECRMPYVSRNANAEYVIQTNQITLPVFNEQTKRYEFSNVFSIFKFSSYKIWNTYYGRRLVTIIAENNNDKVIVQDTLEWQTNSYLDFKDKVNSTLKNFDPEYPVIITISVKDESELELTGTVYIPEMLEIGEVTSSKVYFITSRYLTDSSFSNLFLYRYKESADEAEWGDLTAGKYEDGKLVSFEQAGIYEVYGLRYKSDSNIYYVCESVLGKPFYYYKDVDSSSASVNFPDFQLPDIDNLEYEKNTGMAKGSVKMDFSNIENDYEYYLKFHYNRTYYPYKGEESYYFSSGDFEIKNGFEYEVSVIVKDKNGKLLCESEKKSFFPNKTDNFSPTIQNNSVTGISTDLSYYLTSNSANNDDLGIWDLINTQSRGIYSDTSSIKKMDYWWIPYKNLSLDDVKKYSKKTIAVNKIIPFDGTDYGKFYLYIYAEDSYGNYRLSQTVNSRGNFIVNEIPDFYVDVDEEEFKLFVNCPQYTAEVRPAENFPAVNINNTSAFAGYQYLENNKWKNCSELHNEMILEETQWNYEFTSGSENFENNYIRVICLYRVSNSSGTDFIFTKPLFIYPDYYRYKGTENEIECQSKNYVQGAAGLQIFTDNPCFVHTMYCSKKLTETASPADALEWEARAIETGIMQKQSNFTYSSDNLSEIPAGYYYTTIIHYADGSTLMTDVKKK
jgi:hypothetical protein